MARDEDEFERWVEEAIEQLPPVVRELLDREGIGIHVRDVPPPEHAPERGVLYGIFVGLPYAERRHRGRIGEPTRIEIYERALRSHFSDPAELRQQVRQTVVHEVGHYLGMDEPSLRELEQRLS